MHERARLGRSNSSSGAGGGSGGTGGMGGEGGTMVQPNTSSGASLRNDSGCAITTSDSQENRPSAWFALLGLVFVAAQRRKHASRQ